MSSLQKKVLIKGKGVDEETLPLKSFASHHNQILTEKTKLKRKKIFNLKYELNKQ